MRLEMLPRKVSKERFPGPPPRVGACVTIKSYLNFVTYLSWEAAN